MTINLESYNFTSDVLTAAQEQADKIAVSILSLSGAQRWSYARFERLVLGAGQWLLKQNFMPETGVVISIEDPVLATVAKLGAISVGMVAIEGNGIGEDTELDIGVVYYWKKAELIEWELELPAAPVACGADQLAYIWVGPNAVAEFYSHSELRDKALASLEGVAQSGYEITASDRVFQVATLEQPWLWVEVLCGMWLKGATVLVPNKAVSLSQFPLLLRRHDASVFIGSPAQLGQILSRDLPELPKLKCGIYWRAEPVDLLHDRWKEKMNGPLLCSLGVMDQVVRVNVIK